MFHFIQKASTSRRNLGLALCGLFIAGTSIALTGCPDSQADASRTTQQKIEDHKKLAKDSPKSNSVLKTSKLD